MKALLSLVAVMLASASPAFAEQLKFDHRLHPPLKAVLDSGNADMVFFDGSNPRYVIDRIAISGKSAKSWTEALEIIARSRSKEASSPTEWMEEIRAREDRSCTTTQRVLAQDENSLTFERRASGCHDVRAPFAIYRIVAGKKSLFLLEFMAQQEVGAEMRANWLAVLASAHLD